MLTAALCLTAALALATPASAPGGQKIDSVAWMAGHWVGTNTKDVSEAVWLSPAAGGMLGPWRWASDGKLRLYELLAITEEGSRVALRLRHFLPNMNGLEEKDEPSVLPAVKIAGREVVFEGKRTEGLLTIGYRSPTPDTLEAYVEKGGSRQVFSYRRRGSQP